MSLKQPVNHKEQGAILFISLIMLLLITMVAVSSTRLSTMGQRVSLTYQLQNSTFQAADSVLAARVNTIDSDNTTFPVALLNEIVPSHFTTSGNHLEIKANIITTRERVTVSSLGVGKGLPSVYRYQSNSIACLEKADENNHCTDLATLDQGYQIVTELEQVNQIRTLDQ